MATLSEYLAQTRSLLDDATGVEYTDPNLTIFINDARVQIAGASEAIRGIGSIPLAIGTQAYALAAITGLGAGIAGVLAVRKGAVNVAGAITEIYNREWEWFWSYALCGPAAASTGTPNIFSQQLPGVGGNVYVSPSPAGAYTASFDCVGYPIPLVNDSTVEALPFPWSEAVQYYSAYLAYLNAQRAGDADAMLARYNIFQDRATQMTTPTALPVNYPGTAGAAQAGQHLPITSQRGRSG